MKKIVGKKIVYQPGKVRYYGYLRMMGGKPIIQVVEMLGNQPLWESTLRRGCFIEYPERVHLIHSH